MCTRVVYQGPDLTTLTARTMDGTGDYQSDLWLFPKGMKCNGGLAINPLEWESLYGSVVASAYDLCYTDGMNEKGLVVNLHWLSEAKFPAREKDKQKGLSVALWVKYILDSFETTADVVAEFEKGEICVVTGSFGGRQATVHLSVSDASGDSAIMEYLDEKLVIHHDYSYQVMSNSPIFEEQLALNTYWKEIGGFTFLPGTNRAADRFIRASFYINAIPQVNGIKKATAGVFSVIRACSVPFEITTAEGTAVSSTRWRAVSDQKSKIYYFDPVTSTSIFWVTLDKADLSANASVKKLDVQHNENTYFGDVTSLFEDSEPLL